VPSASVRLLPVILPIASFTEPLIYWPAPLIRSLSVVSLLVSPVAPSWNFACGNCGCPRDDLGGDDLGDNLSAGPHTDKKRKYQAACTFILDHLLTLLGTSRDRTARDVKGCRTSYLFSAVIEGLSPSGWPAG
jgi:hypothetical protein